MFQKFYKDTLGGRYIKSLLAQTPLPVFDSVVDGDYLIQGCYYVYRDCIIKCHTSGILNAKNEPQLYPSETLYPSVMLYVNLGYRIATFYVKSLVVTNIAKTHSKYISNTNYYDPETHYHLGRYLRYLQTTTGLNLFPYYNCYNGTYLSDVQLSQNDRFVNVDRVTKQRYKVVAIPIMFNKTYTIAIDCPTKVLMRAMIYDDTGYLNEEDLPQELSNTLKDSGVILSRLQFNSKTTFRIEVKEKMSIMFQRSLYLVIQLPSSNNSSILVLENYVKYEGIQCDEESVRKFDGVMNPSLLAFNSKESYAFSDRLIEYLLNNIITRDDPISQNIERCQILFSAKNYDYKMKFLRGEYTKGVWDPTLRNLIYSSAEEYAMNNNIYDQDGNINKDLVSILYSKEGINL